MRMSRVIAALCAEGHRVVIYTADEAARYLAEVLPEVPLHVVPTFRYVQRRGGVDYLRTALPGTARIAAALWTIRRLKRHLEEENVGLMLADFEPFASRAARRLKIPCVSLNHQDVMRAFLRPDRLGHAVSFAVVQAVIRGYLPAMDLRIVSSFYRLELPERFCQVGPVFRREVLAARERTEEQDFVLVYADPLLREILMQRFGGGRERFVVYAHDAPEAPPPNFTFRPVSRDFIDALRTCKAVIANGGHQLTSESLLLGKPLLAVPQKGQYEERLNVLHLEKTGGGRLSSHRDVAADLPDFLAGLPTHRQALARLGDHPDFNLEDGTAGVLALLEPFRERLAR